MTERKSEQKLVSFSENSPEFDSVEQDLKEGWSVISLVKNGCYYVGVLEKSNHFNPETETVFIPPRKKLKFLPK